MATRRQVLAAGGGTLAAARLLAKPRSHRGVFASAATSRDGTHWAVAFDGAGEERFRVPLPSRGHQVAAAPDGRLAWVLPRRPGTRTWRVELPIGRVVASREAARGRHFYGHAVFSPDGRRLLVTENDYRSGRGVVSVRDAETFATVAEFDSGGVGPHQLAWLVGGRALAVANGGIRTHPQRRREKLNLESMRPNLTIIDATSGRAIDQACPDVPQCSIRHIASCDEGRIVVGAQHEGSPEEAVPLVFMYEGGRLAPLAIPGAAVWRDMRGYTASVAVDRATGHALVTCPRANLATFWDLGAGRYAGRQRVGDCGGAAVDAAAQEFVVTNGLGMILRFDTRTFALRRQALARVVDLKWDNHLTAV